MNIDQIEKLSYYILFNMDKVQPDNAIFILDKIQESLE